MSKTSVEVAEVEVEVQHSSSIPGARWCRPIGWSPRNEIDGADWIDSEGSWQDGDGDAAGLVVYGDHSEGDWVAVSIDDLRVVTAGDCRVIGAVKIASPTKAKLRWMDFRDKHRAFYDAVLRAKLEDLIPCRWSVEDHEGCDTTWMLRVVCLEQTGERRVKVDDAIDLLSQGHAPRGSTPYPETAEALLARRKASAAL